MKFVAMDEVTMFFCFALLTAKALVWIFQEQQVFPD
jgi:hypothetical protein